MREIKYRGFKEDKTENTIITVNGVQHKGKWIYGVPVQQEEYTVIHYWNSEKWNIVCELVISETVGEYVDAVDAYEGDILYGEDTDEYGTKQSSWYGIVKYNEEHERIMIIDDLGEWYETDDFNFDKIKGNIYENSELMR